MPSWTRIQGRVVRKSSPGLLRAAIVLLAVALLGLAAQPGVGLPLLAAIQFVPIAAAYGRKTCASMVLPVLLGLLLVRLVALAWIPMGFAAVSGADILLRYGGLLVGVVVQLAPIGAAMACTLVLARVGVPLGLAWSFGIAFGEWWVPTLFPYSISSAMLEFPGGGWLLSHVGREVCSFYLASLSWCIALVARRCRFGMSAPRAVLAITLALAPLALGIIASSFSPHSEMVVKVRLLQSAFPAETARSDPDGVYAWHLHTSAEETLSDLDVTVWGESILSVPGTIESHRTRLALPGGPILAGATIRDGQDLTNSVFMSSNCGQHCRYDKQRLIPYVEEARRRPGSQHLGNRGRFSPGGHDGLIRLGERSIGALICFEGMFKEGFYVHARRGADVLVNVVNDGWIASPIARGVLESMTRLNAIEVGLPLVRLVTMGPSTAWDKSGVPLLRLARGKRSVAVVGVPIGGPPSFFLRHRGWILSGAVFSAILVVLWFAWGWGGTKESPGSDGPAQPTTGRTPPGRP